jgi:tetratricopeptide (TPR) repeat protein/mono/diheme cytochrome c family protein
LRRFLAACGTVAALVGSPSLDVHLRADRSTAAPGPAVTFNRDIAPILYAHCATCHRPGEIGPFSLLTYRDARQHVTQIVDATRRRVMPPWKPEAGKGDFIGARVLSADEIHLIEQWAADGAPEGSASDLPPAPQWTSRWQLGTPDLVVTMPDAYTLPADGGDVFRTFVIPIPTDSPRYVRGVEFHPGNPRAVHHANLGVDRTRSSRRLDLADPEPGYVGGMVPDAAYPPGYMLGWTPGQRPRPSPDGMPWRLEPGSDFVVQLHMQPTGKPEPVQVSLGLFFTDTPPARTPVGLRLGSETIDIPPGDADYVISDRYVLPVDVDVLAIQPHAHNLGRKMTAEARLPDGTTRPLISIANWDFRWQDVYRYTEPFALPKGSVISMRFTYDNSDANPRNPFHPPRRIVWGQNTSDEMGDLWIQVVPRTNEDAAALNADINRKTRTEDIAAYTKVLQSDPGNPLRHDAVAMLYLQDGRAREADAEFRASLALNPDSAPTHYNRGLALSMLRDYQGAAQEFQAALRIDPDYADAHNNLGAMLHLFGRTAEAELHYRRATELRPDNAQAHSNLARLLTAEGQWRAAADHFTRALQLQPDDPSALSGLAWLRATAGEESVRDPRDGIRLGERAAQLSGRHDATVLDALAAAYAAAGRFDDATRTAREAAQIADAAGMRNLSALIRNRLTLYESGRAYIAK